MAITIKKSFEFDAGHRLSNGYKGKCARLHGHRYKIAVELSGESKGLNVFDMVTDFNDLKQFKDWLDQTYDHKTMLWRDDPILDFLPGEVVREEIKIMDRNPTAEFMALEIFSHIMVNTYDWPWAELVTAVEVWETPTGMARVER